MSIAVFGGNGFLGRKICEHGVKNGFKVTSFSKSGTPPSFGGLKSDEFVLKVNWESANIFEESSYKSKLLQFDTVFHSMGKMFNDESYKKRLNSLVVDFSFLQNMITGSNPMAKNAYNSMEGVNKTSALILATAFAKAKANKLGQAKFVYISADQGLISPPDYIRTKREAEMELLLLKLNTLIVRPGIMYDKNQVDNRYYFVNGLKKVYETKNMVMGEGNKCVDSTIRPILSTDDVCGSIYKNLHKDNAILTLEEMIS